MKNAHTTNERRALFGSSRRGIESDLRLHLRSRRLTFVGALLLSSYPAAVFAQAEGKPVAEASGEVKKPAPDAGVTTPAEPEVSADAAAEAEGAKEPAKESAPEGDAGESEEAALPESAAGAPEEEGEAKTAIDEETAVDEEAAVEAAPAAEAAPTAEAASAIKQEPRINPDAVPALRGKEKATQRGTIGLEPGAPQAAAMTGGVTPAFGKPSANDSDWVFDIHGYLQLPLRIGMNKRENALEGQKVTVLHTPPEIPGTYGTFEYTSLVPDPWAQLNFSYGNRDVTATVIIAARTVSNANGYFNPADQLGINDAFITFHPHSKSENRLSVHVGAFANRYGIMGEYDMGRYGTPLIGRVAGMGATATGQFKLGSMDLSAEAGVMGPLNKAPVGVEPAGWNGYTDANAGTTFAGHGHVALGVTEDITFGVHGIRAFAQDDRATTTTQKDGNINILAGDVRFSLQRFGHLYVGYAHTDANTARSVSGVVRVLNAPGGLGLMEEYFGLESEGTGQLNTFGGQYDLSLGNLLRYPEKFQGDAPDVVLSGFGLGTSVASPVPEFDGVFKLKYGGEATYTFLKWLGAGVRYDRVIVDVDDATQTHAALSPRLFFKSDWGSRDQVVLQYSRYFYGSNTAVVTGVPPAKDPTVVPDENVFSLTAQIWW